MKTKLRFENYPLYDHTGIAAHLERMAAKGWLLEKVGPMGWRYRKIEPKALRFAVTYFPKADYYDPKPTEQELTFRDFCERAGWKLAAASGQLQIFYNESENPIPMDTDAFVQIENLHAAGKKTFLLTYWLYIAVALLQIFTVLSVSDLVEIFTQNAVLLGVVCWTTLLLISVFDLLNYYGWRKKALRIAGEEGRFLPTKSFPWVSQLCLVLLLAAFAAWLLSMEDPHQMLIFLTSFSGVLLLMFAVNLCRELLKKRGASKTKNLTVTILVDLVLAVFLLVFCTRWVAGLAPETHVDTYVFEGEQYALHNDPLPLYVDQLMEADRADYSNEVVQQEKSLFGWAFLGYQKGRMDRGEPDGIWYYVVEVRPDFAFDLCWEERIEAGGGIRQPEDLQSQWDRGYLETDAALWHADAAYRVYKGQTPEGWYLLRWGNRFARIRLDWEPTAEQIRIISETLSTFTP